MAVQGAAGWGQGRGCTRQAAGWWAGCGQQAPSRKQTEGTGGKKGLGKSRNDASGGRGYRRARIKKESIYQKGERPTLLGAEARLSMQHHSRRELMESGRWCTAHVCVCVRACVCGN